MSADTRRGRDKERRRKLRDNEDGVIKSGAKPRTRKKIESPDLQVAENELRKKLRGSPRDKKIFSAVGTPDASSLTLCNKALFATLHEVLTEHKRLDRYIDPEKVDWDLPPDLRDAKQDYAERKLTKVCKKATTIKLLCDGIIRNAKVQAEMDLDSLPDRLVLEGIDVLDSRLGIPQEEDSVDASSVH